MATLFVVSLWRAGAYSQVQLGDLELHLLIAGHWRGADGGLMFGVVPKVMWEKKRPADGNNMIDMACVRR